MVYQRNWLVNFIPPLLEPLLYLMAFGVGLNRLIGDIDYRGMRLSYAAFIAPGLLAVNMMNNAFFENTYGSFVRMYYQKTFDAMMATPLNLPEIITGEIIWGATKSVIATSIMIGVISLFGFVHYPTGLLVIPLSFLGGMVFGSLGMYFTGTVQNIEIFNLPIFLFITPDVPIQRHVLSPGDTAVMGPDGFRRVAADPPGPSLPLLLSRYLRRSGDWGYDLYPDFYPGLLSFGRHQDAPPPYQVGRPCFRVLLLGRFDVLDDLLGDGLDDVFELSRVLFQERHPEARQRRGERRKRHNADSR